MPPLQSEQLKNFLISNNTDEDLIEEIKVGQAIATAQTIICNDRNETASPQYFNEKSSLMDSEASPCRPQITIKIAKEEKFIS